MNCPICKFSELSGGAAVCPQCHSDLKVFDYLEVARKQRVMQKRTILILSFLLAIAATGWGTAKFISGNQQEKNVLPTEAETGNTPAPATDSNTLASLENKNRAMSVQMDSLKAEIKSLQSKAIVNETTVANGEISHTVRPGESLWIIAKKYYNDGYQFKKLSDQNGLSNPDVILPCMEIKIPK